MIKAIETRYRGYRFRSRLEARWAVYFDAVGILWEYEKEGFDLECGFYLPDFWLTQVEMWAEVKAKKFTWDEENKACTLANESGFPCLMLVGIPELKSYWAHEGNLDNPDAPPTNDYILGNEYLFCESRFYSSTGGLILGPENYREIVKAIEAARSARFEHGENP